MSFNGIIQKIYNKFFFHPVYSVQDVFGCTEQLPHNCPTFVERGIHERLLNELASNNIIVVYGESRQGKTWTIDRYCPLQMRIGCTLSIDITNDLHN